MRILWLAVISMVLIAACDATSAVSPTSESVSMTTELVSTTTEVVSTTAPPSLVTTDTGSKPGEEIWQFDTAGWVRSTPVVAEGVVYFGSSDGHAYAVDAATGQELWAFAGLASTSTPFAEDIPTQGATSVAVANGVVYVVGPDGHVHALEATSGSEVWRFESEGEFRGSPAVSDGLLYIGNSHGHMYALDAGSGSEVWRSELVREIEFGQAILLGNVSSPAVSDGSIYFVADDRHLFALDAATGNQRWRIETPAPVSAPAVSGSVVYLGSRGVNDGHAVAVDAGTGSVLWASPVANWVLSTPTEADGMLYFGIYAGVADAVVYALDADGGGITWQFPTGEAVTASPSVSDGVVYVGSGDAHLYAIDAVTGSERWRFATTGAVFSQPAVSNGVVYVGSDDGSLYAITIGSQPVTNSSSQTTAPHTDFGENSDGEGTPRGSPDDSEPTDPVADECDRAAESTDDIPDLMALRATECLVQAWEAGDRPLALEWASSEAVSVLFDDIIAEDVVLELDYCEDSAGFGYDSLYSCTWSSQYFLATMMIDPLPSGTGMWVTAIELWE